MVKLAVRKGTVQMDSEILSFGRMMRHEIFLVAKLHSLQANLGNQLPLLEPHCYQANPGSQEFK